MHIAAATARTGGDLDDLAGLLGGPTIAPLVRDIRIALGPTPPGPRGPAAFHVGAPNTLILAPSLLWDPAARVHLRHGLELAWLLAEGLAAPLAGLLAARTAALFLALEPPVGRERCSADPALAALRRLGGPCPDANALAALWDGPDALTPAMAARAAELWPLAGPVEHLLATGGDSRLRVDPDTGLNRYGCAPWPRPEAVSFSSCTASSISERGYAAAEDCRRRLLRRAFADGAAAALAAEAAAVRAEILAWYGAAELAEAILSPSGTDATLLLTGLLSAGAREPLTSVLIGPTETGTGIPAAVEGKHFAECTARGLAVAKGAVIDGFPADMRIETIALRGADGVPLASEAVGRRFAQALDRAAASGRAVLHMVDSSKTGLAAPSFRTAARLARRHGERLDVAVDACQARMAPADVRRWLARGWPVLLTGSKFFGGPPFAGVILFPRERLRRIPAGALPAGLADYLGEGAADPAVAGCNPGLALRWSAALADMRAFAELAPDGVSALFERLGAGLASLLEGDRRLHLVAGPGRRDAAHWSDRPTIFTLMVRDPADPARWLSPEALVRLYGLMNRDASDLVAGPASSLARQAYHIGQPVLVGQSPAGPIGGLRIAFGARHAHSLADAARLDVAVARIMGELEACFGKLTLLLG